LNIYKNFYTEVIKQIFIARCIGSGNIELMNTNNGLTEGKLPAAGVKRFLEPCLCELP
jgi:hypothetical protein